MAINLVRIDDRLIHGQIVHAWIDASKANILLIADDAVLEDRFQQTMLKMAAPKSINLFMKSIADTQSFVEEHKEDKLFIIVRDVESFNRLLDTGFHIDAVNLGNISDRKSETGRRALLKNIHVDQHDVDCLMSIADKGVKIEIRLVPDEKPIDAIELINNNY